MILMLLSFAAVTGHQTLNICTTCKARSIEDLNECAGCHTFTCQHRACPCPPSKRDLLEDHLWEAEDEVWQLKESEKIAPLSEWQLGKKKMLQTKIEKLTNQLRIV